MSARLSADYVRKSYRYLRIGLIASVVLLVASIALEVGAAPDCFQTSISGYYYTPVRGVFVSVLVAIGVALIAIKGRGLEDVWLNFAGMMAPVVAFVPTRNAGDCWSTPAFPIPEHANIQVELSKWAATNVGNNFRALVIAGLVAVAAAAILLAVLDKQKVRALVSLNEGDVAARRGIAVMFGVVVVVWGLYELELEWFRSQMHNGAAILMFVFLAAASVANALRRDPAAVRLSATPERTEDELRALVASAAPYRFGYWAIPIAMAVVAGLILLVSRLNQDWAHSVLWLEAIEIGLFAIYWGVQTREHWNEEVEGSA